MSDDGLEEKVKDKRNKVKASYCYLDGLAELFNSHKALILATQGLVEDFNSGKNNLSFYLFQILRHLPPIDCNASLKTVLFSTAAVGEFGANKYARFGYQSMEVTQIEDFIDAMCRHLISYLCCEENDSDSGLSHVSHIASNVLIIASKLGSRL